ncbi:MAG: hypothetical protein QXR89_04590 [Candidatus Bathyarchaeia archaeon]
MDESFESTFKEKVGELTRYLSVSELPDVIKARLVRWEFKEDKRGNECCYIHLETENKEIIVQKFTRSTWLELYDRLKRVGFDRIQKDYVTWVKSNVGRAINPRLLPIVEKRK